MIWIILYNLVFWSLVATILHGYWQSLRSGWKQVKNYHSIPCGRCVYFTRNYRLKCAVNPCVASSLEAINCPHFESV